MLLLLLEPLPMLVAGLTGAGHAPARPQACPFAIVPHWPTAYRSAVQALLLCARRGRTAAALLLEIGGQCSSANAGSADSRSVVQASSQAEPPCAGQLALLPHDVLLRIAVLAAAPLSVW